MTERAEDLMTYRGAVPGDVIEIRSRQDTRC